MDKVKVVCAYCGVIVEVDKWIADKLGATTAFCCEKCLSGKPIVKNIEHNIRV